MLSPSCFISSGGVFYPLHIRYWLIYYTMKEYSYKEALEIKALIDFGLPKAVIARRFGISRQAVYDWMAKLEKQMKTNT